MMEHPEDLTPTQRGALIISLLRDGKRMDIATIAQQLGVTRQWAHYLMVYRITPSIPGILHDDQTGEYFYSDNCNNLSSTP